jgi:hypothetical protein
MKAVLYKTLEHFFPDLQKRLKAMDDPRNPGSTTYGISVVMWEGILMYLLKLGARRQITYELSGEDFVRNLEVLAGEKLDRSSHDGTVAYLFERLDPEELKRVRFHMIQELIRKKCFINHRLLGYYPVVLDGTGYLAFKEPHCEHCMQKKIKDKDGNVVKVYYYHPVLEAKLVLENGMALSMGTEFIENPHADVDIQDCELKAGYRLMERLKSDFPQLRICLLLDGLYAGMPTLTKCDEYRWKCIITFKQGSMPETWDEFESLKDLQPEHAQEITKDEIRQHYQWVTDIGFRGPRFDVVECTESTPDNEGKLQDKRFVWATNFSVREYNVKAIAKGGRLRWKIENEGFNMQKTGGYNLEHPYSEHPVGLKNFYLALQIAHIISQLMEKGSLLKGDVKKLFGSIRNFTRRLLESLRTSSFQQDEIEAIKSSRIQIRLRGPD